MTILKEYTLPLKAGAPEDLKQVEVIFEENASLFDDHILSAYGEDARYSVLDGSFEVLSLTEDFIEFTAKVNFYSGCSDQDEVFDVEGSVDYAIQDGNITFELDETVWHSE
jgi:hypothetical protein